MEKWLKYRKKYIEINSLVYRFGIVYKNSSIYPNKPGQENKPGQGKQAKPVQTSFLYKNRYNVPNFMLKHNK